MSSMFKRILVINTFLLTIPAFSQNLEFYREDIIFKIHAGYFNVEGFYFFRNTGETTLRKMLTYPFKTDDQLYGPIDNFQIKDITDKDDDLLIRFSQEKADFIVTLDPLQKKRYRISYRQQMKTKKAEYILTTTRKWGGAFEVVHYWLELPKNMSLEYCSYEPDSTYINESKRFYTWEISDFMPDRNFILQLK